MLDNLNERRSEMSEARAQEIIDFINGSGTAQFGNVRNKSNLAHLAKMAYHSLGLTVPGSFEKIIGQAAQKLGKKQDRLGLDIGPERAQYLVNHLTGKEADPRFRKEDDITKIREILRKALATVARGREDVGDDTTHSFIVQGDRIIEEKYPLN